MAGFGIRFKGSPVPKPLIQIDGKTLIHHAVETLGIKGHYIFVTRTYDNSEFNREITAIFESLDIEFTEIRIDFNTSGASETCLQAKHLIDNDSPLIISNTDQLMRWNPNEFLMYAQQPNVDGVVVLYKSKDPKNSFAEILDGKVIRTVEKKRISEDALVGIHYWKKGSDFVNSANRLQDNFKNSGAPETYISETFNFLIKQNKNILPYFIPKSQYISLGTPQDLAMYLGKINEFYIDKPKTIFCDIDGTILKHVHMFSDILTNEPELNTDVVLKFNQWDSIGHKIILVTARKESAREMTELHLKRLGLMWDILIMGVTSGVRVLINDKLDSNDPDRALAINVITDSGFDTVNWDVYKL